MPVEMHGVVHLPLIINPELHNATPQLTDVSTAGALYVLHPTINIISTLNTVYLSINNKLSECL